MRRLTVTLLLVVLVAIFGLGIALDTLFERYNTEPQDEFAPIQTLASGWATVLNQSDSPASTLSHWPDQLAYQASIDSLDEQPIPEPLKAQFVAGNPLILESESGVSMHYYLPLHQQVLSINTPLKPDAQHRPIAIIFTSLFYAGTLMLVLLWLKPLLSRLNLLRKTTRAFGTGELTSRVPRNGLSYIRDIETDFNSMADRIQQLVDDNKLLSSAVSHDLRTPLARLRFGIETLAETTDPQAREQYHRRIGNDLTEMENLVNSLLRYARLDNVLADIARQPVSLRQLLHECSAHYYDSNLIIKIDESTLSQQDTLTINGAIEHLATAFNNLIQNATDHATNKLVIVLTRKHQTIDIAFHDDGPGIPHPQRTEVLKPFQRGTQNTNSGYGLGLAVVERIAKHHQAKVGIATSEKLGGACISLRFDMASN